VGNPDLLPETSKTFEIGFDLSYEELNFSSTYFSTDATNLINSGPATDGSGRSQYFNIGKAKMEGFEFELNADLGKRLLGDGYSLRPYLNLNILTSYWDKVKNQKIDAITDKTAGYGISFATPNNDLTASLSFQYFVTQIYRPSRAPETTFGKTTQIDFFLTKKLISYAEQGDLTLKVAVNNLGDETIDNGPGYPNPARNFYVALCLNY
jgi:vitamin B12 transporter